MQYTLYIVCSLCVYIAGVLPGVASTQPSEYFTNHEILDPNGNYELFWKYNKTHITFETHVMTLGYTGFGISPHGKMFPSDIVIGWVKDGKTHFHDRHSLGHYEPEIDKSQDWILLSGKEENGKTILKFARLLDTCDKEDRAIEEGTVKVIYSWYPEDPGRQGLEYHGPSHRGSKSLLLLSPTQHRKLPNDAKYFDFINKKFQIPSRETYYHCVSYKLPNIGGKNHVVMFEPIIEKGNEDIVHHILVYHCPSFKQYNQSLNGLEYECYGDKRKGREFNMCMSYTFLAWAVGGGPFFLPNDVGFPIGEASDSGLYILETHYNNPARKPNITDSSGLRMHYTPTRRKYDGGILYTGTLVDEMQLIPPGYKDFISSGYCSSNCTRQALQNQTDGVNIFGIFPHSHLLGNAIRARIIRNGVESVISDDEHYDFDYQETRLFNKEIKLKAGDVIKTECLYKSDNRKTVTVGGLSTKDEMCISFLMYYPLVNLRNCASIPLYEKYINQSYLHKQELRMKIEAMNWTDQAVRAKFQKDTDETMNYMQCRGADGSRLESSEYPPEITKKYVKDDVCSMKHVSGNSEIFSGAGKTATPSFMFQILLFFVLCISNAS